MRGDLSAARRQARRAAYRHRLIGSAAVGLGIAAYWLGRSAGLW